MHDLNKIELEIFKSLAKKYITINEHLPFIKVKNRRNTGVGMYVEIVYSNTMNLNEMEPRNNAISTNQIIMTSNLKHGVGYEVDVAKGKINFIEFFTYGEEWDGTFPDFYFKQLKFDK